MRLVLRIALCCSLAFGVGMAQRRGGGGSMGGGSRGGGGVTRGGGGGSVSRGGGGFTGGGGGGGITRGGGGGSVFRGGGGFTGGGSVFRGGGGFTGGGSVFRGGFNRFSGFRGSFGRFNRPFFFPGFGLGYGYGYSPWYDDYGYDYGYNPYPAYSYPVYQPSPSTTVVYAPPAQEQAPTVVYVERANPLTREYDQYGQQISGPTPGANSASPLYLIAFRDHSIRAAAAYWVEGGTLHYVTLEHEQKQAALGTVDRDLSEQLNRERRVAFSLPASQ